MSKYKKIMLDNGIMQKDLLEVIHRVDNRVDKSLLSKMVNDVCLPIPKVLETICNYLNCNVLDLYDIREIDIAPRNNNLVMTAIKRQDRGGKSHGDNVYNLTIELWRDVAERVFNKQSLKLLGFKNKTECIRHFVYALDKKLKKIKEKAAKDNNITNGDQPIVN